MTKNGYIDARLLIKIELEVCKEFNLTRRELHKKTKQQPLPRARKVVMVVGSVCGLSQQLMSRSLGMDRSIISKATASYYRKPSTLEEKKLFNRVFAKIKNCT